MQGCNEGGQRGHNSPGVASLWGRRSLWGAPKSPNSVASSLLSSIQYVYFGPQVRTRLQVRNRGRQTCFLHRKPSNLLRFSSYELLLIIANAPNSGIVITKPCAIKVTHVFFCRNSAERIDSAPCLTTITHFTLHCYRISVGLGIPQTIQAQP